MTRIVDAGVFVAELRTPEYVLRPILQRGYLYALTAHPNHGKTALAHRLAFSISAGRPDVGTRVRRGRVLLLCGENPDDSRVRFIALSEAFGYDLSQSTIHVWPQANRLAEALPAIVQQANAIGEFQAVFVDTAAAYYSYEDENDNAQARQHAQDCRVLTRLRGQPCVVVLCHPSKGAGRDNLVPRGGSGFNGEIDTNLTLWYDGELATLHHLKIRGPAFEPMTWRYEAVKLRGLVDVDGEPVSSVLAVPVSGSEEDKLAHARTSDEDSVLEAILEDSGGSLAKWATTCGWIDQKSKVHRILHRLADDQLARRYRGRWILTPAGKRAAKGNGAAELA